jgi:DNA-binding GntR family transcriptional regulator
MKVATQDVGKPILLKDQAYQQLKQMLVDGTYVPGTFLSERRLVEQLGMSKTPVRAALERVEAEGYIAVSPQQGIVVVELSLREIKERYEIRIALETYIVRRLAGNLTLDQIDPLAQNLESQDISIREGDTLAHVAHDRDCHLLLAACL